MRVMGDEAAACDERGFGLVEALIAIVVLSVGLLAIAGIALSVATQTRGAAHTTRQALAGQQVLEVAISTEFDALPVGTTDTTVTVGNSTFDVTRTVTREGPRLKEIEVRVPGSGDQPGRTMMTRVDKPLLP